MVITFSKTTSAKPNRITLKSINEFEEKLLFLQKRTNYYMMIKLLLTWFKIYLIHENGFSPTEPLYVANSEKQSKDNLMFSPRKHLCT